MRSAADRTAKPQIRHNDLSVAHFALRAGWSVEDIVRLLMWLHQRNGEAELAAEDAAALADTANRLGARSQNPRDPDD